MTLRVTAAMLLPLFIGAAAHMLFAGGGFVFGKDFLGLCERLYLSGARLSSGGLAAGLLSMALEKMFSVYGAIPVLLLLIAGLCMCVARLTPAKLAEKLRGRRAAEYEPEPEEEPAAPKGRRKGRRGRRERALQARREHREYRRTPRRRAGRGGGLRRLPQLPRPGEGA